MSIMASSGEDLVTLDEALAFINFCDDVPHDESLQSSAMVPSFRDSFTLEDIDDLLDVEPVSMMLGPKTPSVEKRHVAGPIESPSPPMKKRMRSVASSSTVLQRRKKAELQTLRNEVGELGAFLNQLRKAVDCSGVRNYKAVAYAGEGAVQDDEDLSEWHRHAIMQYQQRHQSEQMNRRLKEMLEQQWKISNKLRGTLHKRNVLDGLDFVRAFETPRTQDSFLTVDNSILLMDLLEVEVESAYRNFRQTFQPREDSTMSCSSETTYDEKCKANVMEFVTTTPLDWSMRAAFNNVWSYLENTSDRSRKPNTLETKVNLTLPLRNSAACHFHKLHFLRKYEEEDRLIIIWSDIIQMTTKNLRVRTTAHSVFARSGTSPSNTCVMHTYLKLYLESPGGAEDVSPEDIRYGQEVVLGAFGRLMRQFWQGEQNRLLEAASC
ncbi:hypothetical protein PRNP1_012787 [Phytophthora ramorum]